MHCEVSNADLLSVDRRILFIHRSSMSMTTVDPSLKIHQVMNKITILVLTLFNDK